MDEVMATKLVEPNQKLAQPIGLVRGLGAYAAAAIVVGTMIGTGIFLKPSEMAAEGKSEAVPESDAIAENALCAGGMRESQPCDNNEGYRKC